MHVAFMRVHRHTAGIDLRIAQGDTAEGHDQRPALGDALPRAMLHQQLLHIADDMRQDHLTGGKAVGVFRGGSSAEHVHEAAQLALSVVKPSGAGPAVRTGEDRLVPMVIPDAVQFPRHEIEGLVPTDGDKAVVAAPIAIAAVKKALSHHGLSNPAGIVQRFQHSPANRRGGRIIFERF